MSINVARENLVGSSGKTGVIPSATSPPMCGENNMAQELDQVVTELFTQYSTAICAYIYALIKDWQLAQELTQETYLKLYRTRSRLPEVENQRAWVYRIAHNLTINEVKRRRRFTWLPWRFTDDSLHTNSTESTDQINERADLEETLKLLPEPYRSPLLLYSSHGLSVREVADTLNLSESAVKVRLHRARKMFRELYRREDQP